MPSPNLLHLTLLSLLLPLLSPPTHAHTFMTKPDAYNRVYRTISCVGEECNAACPRLLTNGMRNTPSSPAATYARGDSFMLHWAKNNHRGGLVRFALVPIHSMMSRTWHSRLAIWYGCWESGLYHCTGDLCGSDDDNEGFRRKVTVPNVYPNGIYVAAVAWYGGLHYSRDHGRFPDHYSCSFVRIEGGPLASSFQPFWEAGDTGKFKNGDLCETATDALGKCSKLGCRGPSFWSVAKEFKNGNKPDKITPQIVADAFEAPPQFTVNSPLQPPSSPAPKSGDGGASQTPRTQAPPRTQSTRTQPPPKTKAPRSPGKPSNRGPPICLGRVCCPHACGKCGGQDCHKRPAGGQNCCYTVILRSGRKCDDNPPPCIRR